MSEYWVSKKKYFCKYCEIYIADDVPSRRQHENGLRHQGNRERFIRNIYKSSEKKKKDLEEEKRELARVEQAANAAFAQDISAGNARPTTTSSSSASGSTASVPKPKTKPSNPFTDYTTPESLGYTDPDTEQAAAEAELRRTQGVVGDWQVVTPSPPPHQRAVEPPDLGESVQIPSKRESETHSDDDFDRHSKLRKRTIGTGLGEIYDPGIITIKKPKKEEPAAAEARDDGLLSPAVEQEGDTAKPTGAPKWVKVQWKKTDEAVGGVTSVLNPGSDDAVKTEVEEPPSTSMSVSSGESLIKADDIAFPDGSEPPKTEEISETAAVVSLFKKRKTPASAGAGRSQRRF